MGHRVAAAKGDARSCGCSVSFLLRGSGCVPGAGAAGVGLAGRVEGRLLLKGLCTGMETAGSKCDRAWGDEGCGVLYWVPVVSNDREAWELCLIASPTMLFMPEFWELEGTLLAFLASRVFSPR